MKTRKYIIAIICLVFVIIDIAATPPDYKGKPWNGELQYIPGKIIAAFYDEGGEGIAFHNPATKNNGSEGIGLARNGRYEVGISSTRLGLDKFKDGTDVAADKYYVGWIVPEEWLNYSVDVKASGTYQINMLFSTAKEATEISLSADGVDKTGAISLETTGHVHIWLMCTNIAEIKLEKGRHVLTLKFLKQGYMNLQYLEFIPKVSGKFKP
jgi:hypothetical protein